MPTETPFNLPIPNPGLAKTIHGQQVYRADWFGSYVLTPNQTVGFLNLTRFRKIMGTDEQAPPGHSQDEAHFEMAGASGMHGGGLTFYTLNAEGGYVAPPTLLIPLVARDVEGLADINVEGVLHSHWTGKQGQLICLSHWNFPGGYVLSGEDAAKLLADPNGEASAGLLKEIRRGILTP